MSEELTNINDIMGIVRKSIHWDCRCKRCKKRRDLMEYLGELYLSKMEEAKK